MRPLGTAVCSGSQAAAISACSSRASWEVFTSFGSWRRSQNCSRKSVCIVWVQARNNIRQAAVRQYILKKKVINIKTMEATELYKCLADPYRLRILKPIWTKARYACVICIAREFISLSNRDGSFGMRQRKPCLRIQVMASATKSENVQTISEHVKSRAFGCKESDQ